MLKIFYITLSIILLGVTSPLVKASEILGGEVTWDCLGNGDYVFELRIYRDCNGIDVNPTQTLNVWGHPTVTSISLDFVDRTDISPPCTEANGISPLECGVGDNSGSGVGAIEEVVYRSNPISITGIPPNNGWFFTYQSPSIGNNLTNIQNPSSSGITLSAAMYPIPGATGSGCLDNSPEFLQSPYFISCTEKGYKYDFNAVDIDLDSLHFSWAEPYTNFPTGAYSPPVNPAPIQFATGYAFNNPTPDASFDSGNQPATLNSNNGKIQFKSLTPGGFLAKVIVDSYRKGVKIATVEREMQFLITDCSGTNKPPIVTPPFANTSLDTTIYAGDAVSFKIKGVDSDKLQDGEFQSVTISASGFMFGENFTDVNNGCVTPPCATLNYSPSITGVKKAELELNWQTSCDHLVGATGEAQNSVPYIFVFKVQDNYCPVPQVRYATVTINVKNRDVLPPPEIECISTSDSGSVTIQWEPITDPFGSFSGYEINGMNGVNYGVMNDINTDNYVYAGGGQETFFISTLSGCGGNTKRNSDTLSNIFLSINNSGNGLAILNWNTPSLIQQDEYNSFYYIYKEYPAGMWALLDSVPYNITHYSDTIRVCEEYLSYQVVLPTERCDFTSNIVGDVFQDKIVPNIPFITSVSIDTATNNIMIIWDENKQPDTYGYVIYQKSSGNFIEIDTVWGKSNTTYIPNQNLGNGPVQYSVAAFDSCYTTNQPPTYQTSAKANPHTTNQLTAALNVCSRSLNLSWTGYKGFSNFSTYIIFARINNGSWQEVGQTIDNSFSMDIAVEDEVIVVVQAISDEGYSSFSNIDTMSFAGSRQPEISYLSIATVEGSQVVVKHRVSTDAGVKLVELERFDSRNQSFEKIDEKLVNDTSEIIFIDEDVEVDKQSYTYRTRIIDTCGQFLSYSNIGKTIQLNVMTKEETETHTLQWTPYEEFIGNLYRYEVYRSLNGSDEFETTPLTVLTPDIRTYTDYTEKDEQYNEGRICYLVIAVEGNSEYGFEEKSYSNISCGVIEPTIYIPNAFTIGGKNPIFKPETRLHQIEKYSFEIFDRYGRSLFSTNEPEIGWDGRIEGKNSIAAEGVYLYRLSLRDGNGIEVLKHGHVTLINYNGISE